MVPGKEYDYEVDIPSGRNFSKMRLTAELWRQPVMQHGGRGGPARRGGRVATTLRGGRGRLLRRHYLPISGQESDTRDHFLLNRRYREYQQ